MLAVGIVAAAAAWLGKPLWRRIGQSLKDWKAADEQIEREEQAAHKHREDARREVDELFSPAQDDNQDEKNQI